MAGASGPGEGARAFVADPEAVYAYAGRFFEALAAAGVRHVVISPGSRSTPLAISAERCPALRTWIELDERAAAFFALGIGKATGRPAALVCTSGTAAANYLPAVVEAHHARVPLVLLTADRPSELRDMGAGQTIEQPSLYGRHPRWSAEVPIAEAGEGALRHAALLAARAVEHATARPAGAVHLNWPLREPLAPPPRGLDARLSEGERFGAVARSGPRFSHAQFAADPQDVDELVGLVRGHARGIVVCGPMDANARLATALARFAACARWPLFADPASQLRRGSWAEEAPLVDAGDLLARTPAFTAGFRPEVVLRIGDPPVSKALRLAIEAAAPTAVWWLDEGGQWGEPSRQATRVVRGGAAELLEAASARLAEHGHDGDERSDSSHAAGGDFAGAVAEANAAARTALDEAIADPACFSGLAVAKAIAAALPADAQLFASNSMAIRLLDLAMGPGRASLRVLCNRGASGIDGITSTALGCAAATGRPTLLLTGDLAFLHDLSGLLITRREVIPATIVVLDDDGGGIFSFLPVAEQAEAVAFDRLFRTPHGLDLARAAALFELDYHAPASLPELSKVLAEVVGRERTTIVHVRVDAAENVRRFCAVVARASAAVAAGVGARASRSVFVEVEGIRLHALVDDAAVEGSPEVLVLHGFTGSAASMEGVAHGLAPFARVARLELVGHGASDAPTDVACYSMEACARQIAAAARALGFSRPHLLGYSMGGRAALAAAVAQPEAFASLVLVGATSGIGDPAARAARIAADEALADGILRDGLEAFVDTWMAQPLFASQARLPEATRARARRERLAQRPIGLANSLRGMGAGAQPPLADGLARLSLPVLLVVGEEDAKFRAIADELARTLVRARIEVVAGVGHAAHLEAPEAFAAVVRRFVSETPSAP